MAAAGSDVAKALAEVMQSDRGRLIAALIGQLGDFQLAEDALQDATEAALVHWGRSGLAAAPQGWLLQVARRKAIDRLRRRARFRDRAAEIARLAEADAETTPEDIPDERLRLIFTCCHPALAPKTRIALTLRTLGGLGTADVARAFLDNETAMGQRLSRARAKIRDAAIPYRVPGPEEWTDRLASVLAVIYLIFTQGHRVAPGAPALAHDLCREAIWLARLLTRLRQGEAEVEGLLALMLITHARAPGADAAGFVPLSEQDRGAWDGRMLADGLAVLNRAVARGQAGPYQIKAAISACHAEAETDWRQVVMLYDALLRHEDTDVVRLNRAVALSHLAGLEVALREVEALGRGLQGYQPYHAARADLLARLGRSDAARESYARAIALSDDAQIIAFLEHRRSRL